MVTNLMAFWYPARLITRWGVVLPHGVDIEWSQVDYNPDFRVRIIVPLQQEQILLELVVLGNLRIESRYRHSPVGVGVPKRKTVLTVDVFVPMGLVRTNPEISREIRTKR